MPTNPDRRPPSSPVETQVDTTRQDKPGDPANQAKLPHERDESIDMTDDKVDPEMKQAHSDLARGLEDTDARGADGKPLGSKKPTK